ncbi:formimidoylglutamate deiminase, partial [Pseudomonas aeruginosa]
MSAIFAERALLPDGWARDVRFEVCPDGVLAEIRRNANAAGAERLGRAVLPG